MQIVSKPYAAHGWLAVKASYSEGGEYIFNITSPAKFPLLLYTKGRVTIKDIESKNIVSVREVGFWNKDVEDFSKNSWLLVVEPNTEVWCFDAAVNHGIVPPAELFSLGAGESCTLSAGEKLFLCAGLFIANGRNVEGPTQLSVSDAITVTAATRCLGVRLP